MATKIFKSTKQKTKFPNIFGFDIETYDRNKKLYCWSIVGELKNGKEHKVQGFTKDGFIQEIKKRKYRNSKIIATNLAFDFFGIMFGKDEVQNFKTLFRGSSLLGAKTYYDKSTKSFVADSKSGREKIEFLDSMNFAPFSVAKLGQIINLPKLNKPKALGRLPRNKAEAQELLEYNIRDSEVTFKFMKFFFKALIELGANIKTTIASTSMSLYRNKYLKNKYFLQSEPDLLFQFKSYYGGRTEVLKRGTFKNLFYHDFNSLYPSVMEENVYPDPNSLKKNYTNTTQYLQNFEGCTEVDIEAPKDIDIPLLPFRLESGKVIFPKGRFQGVYTNVELRAALKLGYKIHKVSRNFYYTRTCTPFKLFVNDLYNLRLKFKKEKNPLEVVIKLIMNSLYGKFGQKFDDRDNFIPADQITKENMHEFSKIEIIGDYARVSGSCDPSVFCIPIWASYVTAYGRLKLYPHLKNAIYCDTDSIITDYFIETSKVLGKLELEYKIKEAVFVKPKCYAVKYITKDNQIKSFVKIKGLGASLTYNEFNEKVASGTISKSYDKFIKFKEAVRRGFQPNEIVPITKNFDIEDTKRIWQTPFNISHQQSSVPITLPLED